MIQTIITYTHRYLKGVHNSVNSISDTDTRERDLLIPMVAKIEESRGKDATLTENILNTPQILKDLDEEIAHE